MKFPKLTSATAISLTFRIINEFGFTVDEVKGMMEVPECNFTAENRVTERKKTFAGHRNRGTLGIIVGIA